jgi:hypothetical protein
MKTQIIQDEPSPAAPPVTTGRRPWLIVVGSFVALLAVLLLVAGGAGLYAIGKRDDAGYFTTSAHRLATPSNALVSERLDIDADVGSNVATSRIQASSTRPVFVGIGPAGAVARYLGSVRHAVIDDLDTDPFRVSYRLVPGTARPAAPASQGFWRVHSSGPGLRTVTWPLEPGHWSIVIMNADGSPGVDVQARLGAHVPWLTGVTIGVLAGGVLLGLAGGLLLRAGLRRPAHTAHAPADGS